MTGDLGHGAEPFHRHVRGAVAVGQADHPGTDAPPAERHPHEGADLDLIGERVGDGVVELLVEARDVRDDPGHPLAATPVGQRPTAALKDVRFPSCSHVKPGSSRPKCPYAAVRR